MSPTVLTSLDDVRARLGTELGPTEWEPVSQERINAFAELTGDHQWIHVDVERAATGPFGGTIAHGYLTLSLLPLFNKRLFRLDAGSARVNYGLNKVRFPSPVPAGSRVRATASFVELRDLDTGSQLRTQYVLELEDAAKPACVAESVTLILP
ncbi:enoyl-CoA hydratase [Prauserella sp. PE36]|uniref:MaoC family dehydratase n=1 Tax=Prauserella sp. PE36 TaxID=1504709 RepID=UPI000D865DD8|nr:MaoC family dehydratase [Prauserella sp. PE36]PXY29279.1 enoyl-CoA hydratase [Prauserella coralliicola]RBM19591.1 enoyl-CoA hydratase [Prauserella sp. PE36]